ncbi:hypothetical protein D7W79_39720 [Corallococcus exercitus]|nr:hypothetical protein D7W79_39720 [Corallococcus exercitus]
MEPQRDSGMSAACRRLGAQFFIVGLAALVRDSPQALPPGSVMVLPMRGGFVRLGEHGALLERSRAHRSMASAARSASRWQGRGSWDGTGP